MHPAHPTVRQFGEPVSDRHRPGVPHKLRLDGRYAQLVPLVARHHARQLFAANRLDTGLANWDYLPYGPFASLDEYTAWLRSVENMPDPYFLAVTSKDAAQLCGLASYLRIKPVHGVIEIGHLHFSPMLQGSRAATEALYLMMEWAFAQGYRRLEWKCDALNLASRRAAQRLGLSFEGVFRQASIYKGRNRDTAWFAAIDKEWPELQASVVRYLDPANFDAGGRQKTSLSDLTRGLLYAQDPLLKHS